jgi:hypothetical protein
MLWHNLLIFNQKKAPEELFTKSRIDYLQAPAAIHVPEGAQVTAPLATVPVII